MYTIETTEEFDRWLSGLKDVKTRTRLDSLTIFVLCGGDKGSQRCDIPKAHELSRQINL